MALWQATEISSQDVYQFRSLASLARRLGGRRAEYSVVHSETMRPPTRQIEILLPARKRDVDRASSIVTVVSVPTEAVEAEKD